MSQIPDAFQGHDLTGWVCLSNKLCRMTNGGKIIMIDSAPDEGLFVRVWQVDVHKFAVNMATAIGIAESFAKGDYGWAPAPIGYEPSGWQPIETAPKDGTRIILGWDDDDDDDPVTAFWGPICQDCRPPIQQQIGPNVTAEYAWVIPGSSRANDATGIVTFNRADSYTDPTHWMPMPQPPQEVDG